MAPRPIVDPDMPVDEVMRKSSATIAVMVRHRMVWIVCPIGTVDTVTDAA